MAVESFFVEALGAQSIQARRQSRHIYVINCGFSAPPTKWLTRWNSTRVLDKAADKKVRTRTVHTKRNGLLCVKFCFVLYTIFLFCLFALTLLIQVFFSIIILLDVFVWRRHVLAPGSLGNTARLAHANGDAN